MRAQMLYIVRTSVSFSRRVLCSNSRVELASTNAKFGSDERLDADVVTQADDATRLRSGLDDFSPVNGIAE
jgi:hypothetical protein